MRLNEKSLGRKAGPVMVLLLAAALWLLSLLFYGLMAATSGDVASVCMFIALAGFAFALMVFAFGVMWLIWVSITRGD